MLIGIAGKAGCGKDTAADYLVEAFGFLKESFANPIKQMINIMLGFDPDDISNWEDRAWKETIIPEFNASPRKLAQTLGTDWGRDMIHDQIWVAVMQRRLLPEANIVIPDVRFHNEATMIRELGGTIVHITRDNLDGVIPHRSESGFPHSFEDIYLDNNGTVEELEDSLHAFIVGEVYNGDA